MFVFCREFAARGALPLGIAIMASLMTTSNSASSADNATRALRQLHMRSLSPPNGVEVTIDGEPKVSISVGAALTFDSRAHRLKFYCIADLCEPAEVAIAPRSGDQDIDLALKIRPARVQIEGNLDHRFMIQEDPSLGSACAGVELKVPLESGQRVVHVIDLQTSRSIAVVLTAGHTTLVSFF
jgi:hypothetical protein